MKRIFLTRTAITLLMIALFFDSYSQTIEKKTYQTLFTKTAPEIDGLENDSCWSSVAWSGDFIQIQPYENKQPTQQTKFKILYDDNNLYVFVCALDT